MQFPAEVWLSAGTALLTTLVGAYLLARRNSAASRSLVAFNLAVAVWTGGNAFQLASTTLAGKLVWINVQYVGIALLPISIFAFAVTLAGEEDRVSRRHLALIGAPLAALVVLSWTNAAHGLVRSSVGLVVVDGVVRIERTFGPAFWLGWVYSNLLNLVATGLVFRTVVYADRVLERRVLALLIGPIVPWLAHFLYLTGAMSVEPELFFSVTGIAFAYALLTWDAIEPTRGRDAVLELLDEGVVVTAGERIVDLNSAARRLLALGDEPAVGEPIAAVLDDHPELLDRFRNGESGEDLVVDADGTRRYLDVRFDSFDDSIGSPDRVIVLVDVSTLRERERALERQNDRLESFASIVSHDLRNPLNVAQGRVELAREEHDSEHLAIAERAHERMTTLIDDILTLTRDGRSVESVEPLALAEIARGAWEVVETDGATLEIEGDGRILGDSSRFRQLFENLFRNSIEHNDGPITVRVGRSADGFYVADDGQGIPDADRDRVFEAGYTTGEDGTGLGLNIVQEIVTAHGWTIEVHEADGGGARFAIRGVVDGDAENA